MENSNLIAMNEVMGAVLMPQLSADDIKALKADANSYIQSNLNLETDAKISIIENSDNEVNLALPFYSIVNEMSAELIKDKNLDDVAGGEILITLFAVAGAAIALIAVPGSVSGTLIGTAVAVGGLVGGITGAAVVGGTAAGAIIGGNAAHARGKTKIRIGAADSGESSGGGGGGK